MCTVTITERKMNNPYYISSDSSSEGLSTDSAVMNRAAVIEAKEKIAIAAVKEEEARVVMEARMKDLQVAENEQGQELSLRAQEALNHARVEYKKKKDYRHSLTEIHHNLTEHELQAETERDLARFGSLGRVPSITVLENPGVQWDDPWEDADVMRPLRFPPPGNRRRVAMFYKKHQWDNNITVMPRLQCMVTGLWSSFSHPVVASRILPKTTSNSVLQSLGLKRRHLNNPRNMVLLSKKIKEKYEESRLTFLLNEDAGDTELGLSFRLKIWDTRIREKKICRGSKLTIGDYEGKVFRFYSDERIPFVRALSLHAQRSYERAIRKHYITADEPRPKEYGSPLAWTESVDLSSDEGDNISLFAEDDSCCSKRTEGTSGLRDSQ
jgi:hypothetical protein